MTCSICLDTITSPCCCIPCGHVFCRKCITRWQQHVEAQEHHMERFAQCPQCRRAIQFLQPVILGLDSDSCTDVIQSRWDQSEWNPVVQHLVNRWQRSTVKRSYNHIRESVTSNDNCQLMWNTAVRCKQSLTNGVQELRHIEGGTIPKAEWVWKKSCVGVRKVHARISRQPCVEKLQKGWETLTGDQKIFVTVFAVICLTIILTDIPNPLGFFQSIILPVIQSIFCVVQEVMNCVLFLVYRPVLCLATCLLEMLVAFWDMLIIVATAIIKIGLLLLYIPFIFVWTLVTWTVLFIYFVLNSIVTLVIFACKCVPVVLVICALKQQQRNPVE